MLEDKMKECDGSYKRLLHRNKTGDMANRIGVVYARRQKKKKDSTNRISVVYVKTKRGI